jgi:hypothetical protein
MGRQNFDAWVPEEYGGAVVTKIQATSAVEAFARHEPMGTDTKHVPRSGGVTFVGAVGKGVAYTEDGSTNDEVLLTARKFGVVVRIADEDIKDSTQAVNIIQTKQLDWARSHSVGFDHACLGTTAVANGTTIPFNSVYYALTQANSATGYSANANIVTSGVGAEVSYTNLSNVVGLVEDSNFWQDGEMVVIAHPSYRKILRGVLDSSNRPIFNESSNGTAGGGQGTSADTLFGLPVSWSRGAKKHATATDAPTGFPLLIVGNRQFMVVGDRSGPEYMLAGADTGAAFLTDEVLLKTRIRRGFAVGNENAFAVLEDNPAAS